MFVILLALTVGVFVAVAVAAYVAYPHRGEPLPLLPRLGTAMKKGVDALPTLEDHASR